MASWSAQFYHACSNSKNDSEYVAFKEREARSVLRASAGMSAFAGLWRKRNAVLRGNSDAPLLKMYGEVAKR